MQAGKFISKVFKVFEVIILGVKMRLGIIFAILIVLSGCAEKKAFPSHKIDFERISFDDNKVMINRESLLVQVFHGESMTPSLMPDSSVIFTKNFKKVGIGDIILFNATKSDCKNVIVPTGLVGHRIVETRGNIYITKGDNNYKNDDCKITFDKIEGLVIGVIY